jgi:DNA-binding response OmpR family regulator
MSDRPKILLVDDEVSIIESLSFFLERCGFAIRTAADGDIALEEIRDHPPDLIVLDILMPRLDGREVLRRLRAEGNWTPVIMLTKVVEQPDSVLALNEGADDYIDKPCAFEELLARINAVLRRTSGAPKLLEEGHRLVSGDLVLDRHSRQVFLDTRNLNLSPRAVTLLEYMMTHCFELLTRERLLDDVWGWDEGANDRAVDHRIAELRRALMEDPGKPKFIETIRGAGYRFIRDVTKRP